MPLQQPLEQQAKRENALLVRADFVQSEPVAQVERTKCEEERTWIVVQVAKGGCYGRPPNILFYCN